MAVAFDQPEAASRALQTLINQTRAMRGKHMTVERADRIISDAKRIQDVLRGN